jgi:sarcosine oxidase subunit delta
VTRELWYHGAGCTSWLRVERDTVTHDILRVELASDAKRGNA